VRALKAKNAMEKAQVKSAVKAKAVLKVYDNFLLVDGRPPSLLEIILAIVFWFLSLPLLVLSLPGLLLSVLFLPLTLPLWIAELFVRKKLLEWVEKRVRDNPNSMFTQWLVFLLTPQVPVYLGRENVAQVVQLSVTRFLLPRKYGIAFVFGPPFPTRLGCLSLLPFLVGRRIHVVLFDGGEKERGQALQAVEAALQMRAVEGRFKRNRFRV
jgi:hypothetical protein